MAPRTPHTYRLSMGTRRAITMPSSGTKAGADLGGRNYDFGPWITDLCFRPGLCRKPLRGRPIYRQCFEERSMKPRTRSLLAFGILVAAIPTVMSRAVNAHFKL